MVLAMSRPWKHPKTGVYWVRRRVPSHLVAIIGKTEEKRSLRTKDPSEAKQLFAIAMAELEVRWRNLDQGAVVISEREAGELTRHIYAEFLAVHRDNPSEQIQWDPVIGQHCFSQPLEAELAASAANPWLVSKEGYVRRELEKWCNSIAEDVLSRNGIATSALNMKRVAVSVAYALQAASLELKSLVRGTYSPDHINKSGPLNSPARVVERNGDPVTFSELAVGWAAERQPAPKTRYTVDRVLLQLSAFIGHDDATQLTASKLIEWKTSLLADGIGARTIKATKFGLLKPILQWGVDNGKISSNPAEKIAISTSSKVGEGRRSFTDGEANSVLQAAKRETKPYLRWVPLICAYTGARISEVCQLRKEDIIEVDGISCLKFSPEAGSLKNANSERLIPLHRSIVDAGFPEFVEKRKAGPLFSDLPPDRFGNRGGSGTKLIGRWVRELGIKDPRISPSHSWRHRFKTLGRRHGLALDIVNAMTGHGSKDVAATYGEFEPVALYRELSKLP